MLIAAAVCPHPPLLVPEVTGASGPGARELGRLRAACREAVAALLAGHPDLLAVIGGADRTGEYPPATAGSLREFGVPYPSAEDAPGPALPLSLTVAKWLIDGAAPTAPPVAWWGVASGAATADCLNLGEKLAGLAPRVALLAMGDGPGRRARGVPGGQDLAARRYDDQVAAALAAADPDALAALGARQDQELAVAGRAAWQVLAGAASSVGAASAGAGPGAFAADLRYAAAPFEVSYFVASWRRAAPPRAH